MNLWVERALKEVQAASEQGTLALRNSLPDYLNQLSDALSLTIDRTHARKRADKEESTRIGKKHGLERACSIEYTMDQMILEYHILRQVLFDVMEEEKEFNHVEREVIICSIEQAVNDAATQFNQTLKEYQEHLSHTLVHDLRNPLFIAKASTQMLLKKGEFDIAKMEMILKNINRIDDMISELLDASRKQAASKPSKGFNDCDLDLILKEVIEGSEIAHGDRFQYSSDGPCIGQWDENSIRRIIENLTTNAVKYGSDDSLITYSLSQDKTDAKFLIHNHGPAIPPAEQLLLFDKYRRSKTAEKQVGWGLGLTVVKGMVEAHKGSIKVASQPQHGTTFEITLPKGT